MKSSTDMQYRYYDGFALQLTPQVSLFRSSVTERTSIVSVSTVRVASHCRAFATLEDHAARIEALHVSIHKSRAALLEDLALGVQHGLLIPFTWIQQRGVIGPCTSTSEKSGPIDAVVIPTRDRPALLARILCDLTGDLAAFRERPPELIVVDDSESDEMQAANRRVVASCARSSRVCFRYGDIPRRMRFAAQLVRASGIQEDSINFALAPRRGSGTSVGGARNVALLETVGHKALFLDDDVRCQICYVPDCDDRSVGLGPAVFDTWFMRGFDDLGQHRCSAPVDLLHIHEDLLNIATSARDDIDLTTVPGPFLNHLKNQGGHVCVSFMGIAGDSAIDNPIQYFMASEPSFARLTASSDIYRMAMRNRLVLRGPTRRMLSLLTYGCSYCMAVDNTEDLPPFLPVHRGEEVVFAALVNRCIPGALFGSIPRAIVHQPLEPRFYPPALAVARAGKLVTSTTLAEIIGSEQVDGASAAERTRALGRRLTELNLLEEQALRQRVKSTLVPTLVAQLQRLSRIALCPGDDSSIWGRDVSAIVEGYLHSLNDRDHSVPLDLEQTFGLEEGRIRFRTLLGKLGYLLQVWPDMRAAAEMLHGKGETACPVIGAA